MASSQHDKIKKHLAGSGGVCADPRSPRGGCGPGSSTHSGPLGAGVHYDLAAQGLHPSAPSNKSGSVLNRPAPKPVPAATYSAVYGEHDQKVMDRINRFIDMVNIDDDFLSNFQKNYRDLQAQGNRVLLAKLIQRKAIMDGTIAQKLDWCWAQNIELRKATNSTDEVGRDADYYFAPRKTIAAETSTIKKYAEKSLGKQAWTLYSALKLWANLFGHDEWMRTDVNKPNAPPGGLDWLIRGANEGIRDQGENKGNVTKHVPTAVAIWEYRSVALGAPFLAGAALAGIAFTALDKLIENLSKP